MSDIILLQSPQPKLDDIQKKIFDTGALDFLIKLHKTFDTKVEELHVNRLKASNDIKEAKLLNFKKSFERNDKSWTIGPLPSRLQNRHLDLGDVSASNTAHFISALSEDVQGIQVDFDDGHCPTWRNQLLAHNNINLAVRGELQGAPSSIMTCPALILRLRPWNMIEHNILIDGKEALGSLVDFGIFMYHNAVKLLKANCGPYFYLSKLESRFEAELWNDIFVWTETELALPSGCIKACVIIDNVTSVFELEEILYALKDHSMGFNCGIKNYCASIISKFGHRKDFFLPDRTNISIDSDFVSNYMKLVVNTCHARGAPASGAITTDMLTPGTDGNDEQSKLIIKSVLETKLKEINIGIDGFLVYDTRIVSHVNEFRKRNGLTNQIVRQVDVQVTPHVLLTMPRDGVTMQSVNRNVAISILFIYHWLAGIGHFFYNGFVEDASTADLARKQVWQCVRFALQCVDEPEVTVTARVIEKLAANFASYAHKKLCRSNAERKRLSAARYMCLELFLARNPPEFISTYLNDSHKFRTLHNKDILSNL